MALLHRFPAAVVVAVVVVVVSCLLVAPPAVSASSVDISTYWGANSAEGSVIDLCNSKLYRIINIGFVSMFGNGRTPKLTLNHPCDPGSHGCTYLGAEIQSCQKEGIKVFISIGGPTVNYNLTSEAEAKKLANYLWKAYLGGKDSIVDRPFGDIAILNGVDFFIDGGTTQYYDVLAEALKDLSNDIELSASPKCHHPDKYLGAAIRTGHFGHVQVRFYNEPCCQYDGSFDAMKSEWEEWTAEDAKYDKAFVGVTASSKDEGYVDPHLLIDKFLTYAVKSPKFGGVTVWYPFNHAFIETIQQWNPVIQTARSAVVS